MMKKGRVFWIHAIIILRTLRNTITIRLIGNLPLQFSSSHIFARFYVSRAHGPTGRRIRPVYWPYAPLCPRPQRLRPPCPHCQASHSLSHLSRLLSPPPDLAAVAERFRCWSPAPRGNHPARHRPTLLLSLRRWRCSNGNAGIFPASLSH
jgi:hypothetical protein